MPYTTRRLRRFRAWPSWFFLFYPSICPSLISASLSSSFVSSSFSRLSSSSYPSAFDSSSAVCFAGDCSHSSVRARLVGHMLSARSIGTTPGERSLGAGGMPFSSSFPFSNFAGVLPSVYVKHFLCSHCSLNLNFNGGWLVSER